jgi:hypothetical protein
VRYTRCGEPGEWCSELCRDGEAMIAHHNARKRRGGRPTKYRNKNERRKANARYQRKFRSHQRLGVRKTTPQPIGTEGFTDAFSRSGGSPTRKVISPVVEALR